MTLPLNLVLVRHGEAENNIAEHRSQKKGDHSAYTDSFRARHTSRHRLTLKGVSQAQAAGRWLIENGLDSFDRAYVSEYVRAMETAGHLGLNVTWTMNVALCERSSGLMNTLPENERQSRFPDHIQQARSSRFFWNPPGGESLADVGMRLRAGFLPILLEDPSLRSVIAVSHGHTIRILRAIFEHVPAWLYEEREAQLHPAHLVTNAHIIHYTRQDPQDPSHVTNEFGWVRSICPWDLDRLDPAWCQIERPRFTGRDLLATVERLPRLL